MLILNITWVDARVLTTLRATNEQVSACPMNTQECLQVLRGAQTVLRGPYDRMPPIN